MKLKCLCLLLALTTLSHAGYVNTSDDGTPQKIDTTQKKQVTVIQKSEPKEVWTDYQKAQVQSQERIAKATETIATCQTWELILSAIGITTLVVMSK